MFLFGKPLQVFLHRRGRDRTYSDDDVSMKTIYFLLYNILYNCLTLEGCDYQQVAKCNSHHSLL